MLNRNKLLATLLAVSVCSVLALSFVRSRQVDTPPLGALRWSAPMGRMQSVLGLPRPDDGRVSDLRVTLHAPFGNLRWSYHRPTLFHPFNTIAVRVDLPNGTTLHRTLRNGAYGLIFQDAAQRIEYVAYPDR